MRTRSGLHTRVKELSFSSFGSVRGGAAVELLADTFLVLMSLLWGVLAVLAVLEVFLGLGVVAGRVLLLSSSIFFSRRST